MNESRNGSFAKNADQSRQFGKRAALAVAAAFLLIMNTGQSPRPDDARPDVTKSDDPATVAAAQRDLARRALGFIELSSSRGAPVSNQTYKIYLWSYRLLTSQLFLSLPADAQRTEDPEVYFTTSKAEPNPDRLNAFEEHWARMKAWEERLRPLVRSGTMPALDLMEVEAHRIQAELWLSRERLRKPRVSERGS